MYLSAMCRRMRSATLAPIKVQSVRDAGVVLCQLSQSVDVRADMMEDPSREVASTVSPSLGRDVAEPRTGGSDEPLWKGVLRRRQKAAEGRCSGIAATGTVTR